MKFFLLCVIVLTNSFYVITVNAQATALEEPSKIINLRTLSADDLVVALTNGELVRGGENKKGDVVSTRILGVVRMSQGSDKSYIELSDRNCKSWSRIPLESIFSATETFVPSVSCDGEKYPYLRLVLKDGEQYSGDDKDGPAIVTMSFTSSTVRRPKLNFGGSLGVSDTIFDNCTDIYLDCQLSECSGSGQWCLDMCEAEFDFCVAGR